MTRAELKQQIFVLVLAKLQSQGRDLQDLTTEELNAVALEAAQDVKFAMEITGEKIEP